jgi:hypothetical protein
VTFVLSLDVSTVFAEPRTLRRMRIIVAVLVCSLLAVGQAQESAVDPHTQEIQNKVDKIKAWSEMEVVRNDGTKVRGRKGQHADEVEITPEGQPLVRVSFSDIRSVREIRHPVKAFFVELAGVAAGVVLFFPALAVFLGLAITCSIWDGPRCIE